MYFHREVPHLHQKCGINKVVLINALRLFVKGKMHRLTQITVEPFVNPGVKITKWELVQLLPALLD